MKKLLPLFSIALIVAACNTSPRSNADVQSAAQQVSVTVDTAGLAAYQQWKAQNELASLEQYNQPVQQVAAAKPVVKSAAKKSTKSYSAPIRKTSTSSSSAKTSTPAPQNNSGSG